MAINQKPGPWDIEESWTARARRFLIEPHPSIEEIGERRRAQLLSIITLALTGSFIWGLLSNPPTYSTFIVLCFTTLTSYLLSRSKYYRIGSYFFSYGFTSISYITLTLGTASSFENTITSIAHVAIIVASVLLSLRGFIILVILSVVATFAAPLYSETPVGAINDYFRVSGVYTSIGFILIGANIFRARTERDRLNDVRDINRALEEITDNLEDRVKERTLELDKANRLTSRRVAQLQTIADLAQAIAQVDNPNEIIPTAASLISERFGFYHVGIFLLDKGREFAVLQAANSEGGKRLLERGHQLMLGTGVVGFAALTGNPRIALNVGADAVYFNNPDLPATRSEVALPLISNGETIGVLDVQSTEPSAFTEEDLQVLGTLANQVTIALENTRLLSEARASAKQVQEIYNEFVRAEWSRTAQKAEQAGFRYNTGRIEMIEMPIVDPEIVSAVESGEIIANHKNGVEETRAVVTVPVKLHGEVIGVLRIESHETSKVWLEEELTLMQAVAERAALAMENARLFQDARRRAAKERLIAEATSRISGSLNIENILENTAVELERVLGGSEVLIRFNSKDSA